MGNAASNRKENRKKYLSRVATENPEHFEYLWERRLDSWLNEIHRIAEDWKLDGSMTKERIFHILDTAMKTLTACGPAVYGKYANHTYNTLCNECCNRVAEIIDPRLYRLSNTATLEHLHDFKNHFHCR